MKKIRKKMKIWYNTTENNSLFDIWLKLKKIK